MDIWGTQMLSDVEDVIDLLQHEMIMNNTGLLKDVKPTTNNLMVTCISHNDGQESNPSMGILLNDVRGYDGQITKAGTCHCFTCGYTSDLPEFVSNVFGYDDKGMMGYKWIIRNFVSIEIDERKQLSLNMDRNKNDVEQVEYIDDEQLKEYRYVHPYMYARGLDDKIINYFDIGYDKQRKAITFPVRDENGNVCLIQRRSVDKKQFINDEGGSKGNYLYGLHEIYKNIIHVNEVFVTESPIDALTLWKYKIPAIATMGTRVTKRQLDLMKQIPIRKMILALDNDEAGHEGMKFIYNQLINNKVMYKIDFPSDINDINEMTESQIKHMNINLVY